ncbi:MAG: enoyl-CoA hydratase-related protein, partial [Pseudomonadota bacterium]
MTVSVERRGAHAILWIDNPPVNATSQAVRAVLVAALEEVSADEGLEGAVLACRGRTFIAGADVKEFGRPPEPPHLPDVVAAIEACPKPIVAAIHGTALGGGLEVALGCHGRVMARSAKAGLPEVTLGLIPGAGGTQRLPRLIGLVEAARMITTGKPIGAAKAEAIGLVDAVSADEALIDTALALLPTLTAADRRLSARELPAFDAREWEGLVGETRKRARGQIAPVKALEALEAA